MLQSQKEIEGVADAVARKDAVDNSDVVVWNVFGLTHNPRVEDWPIMWVVPNDLFPTIANQLPGLSKSTSFT